MSSSNESMSGNVLAALHYRGVFLEGWSDGIDFSLVRHETRDDNGTIHLRITIKPEYQLRTHLEVVEAELATSLQGVGMLPKRSQVIREGFVAGLKFAIQTAVEDKIHVIEPDNPNSRKATPPAYLWRKWQSSGGQRDAMIFAVESEGDLDLLQTKLQDEEQLLSEGLAAGTAHLDIGAAPRMYLDGYIDGLKEAIQIVTRVQGGETLPGVDYWEEDN